MTTIVQEYGRKIGLQLSAKTTKTMPVGHNLENMVTVEGTDIVDVEKLVYLGSKTIDRGE